jgi:methylenetetrahydrofolate reductase (NADPH)
MVATAKRLANDGYRSCRIFPARIHQRDLPAMLENWIAMYQGETGVDRRRYFLAGGVTKPHGDFEAPCSLLETAHLIAQVSKLHVAEPSKATRYRPQGRHGKRQ